MSDRTYQKRILFEFGVCGDLLSQELDRLLCQIERLSEVLHHSQYRILCCTLRNRLVMNIWTRRCTDDLLGGAIMLYQICHTYIDVLIRWRPRSLFIYLFLDFCTAPPFLLYLFSHRCWWILLIGLCPFSYRLHLWCHCLGFLSERDRGFDLVGSLQMRVFELFSD